MSSPARPIALVISQPTFFPWVGMFEQIRLCDVYVHYDDVQFSKGWFINRVQIKTAAGSRWLTVPVNVRLGQTIDEVLLDERQDWRTRHLAFLTQAFRGAPFAEDALALVEGIYRRPGHTTIADVASAALEATCDYFGLRAGRTFLRSSELGLPGHGSGRVLAIAQRLAATRYITGHGARKYLDHEAFDRAGISVEYMAYRKQPYPQLHGEFTASVSILDLIANAGPAGRAVLCSQTVPWRDFLQAAL